MRALSGASLRPMNPHGGDPDRVGRELAWYPVAVHPTGDAGHHHGIDVEPEAQRQHDVTVLPSPRQRHEVANAHRAKGYTNSGRGR